MSLTSRLGFDSTSSPDRLFPPAIPKRNGEFSGPGANSSRHRNRNRNRNRNRSRITPSTASSDGWKGWKGWIESLEQHYQPWQYLQYLPYLWYLGGGKAAAVSPAGGDIPGSTAASKSAQKGTPRSPDSSSRARVFVNSQSPPLSARPRSPNVQVPGTCTGTLRHALHGLPLACTARCRRPVPGAPTLFAGTVVITHHQIPTPSSPISHRLSSLRLSLPVACGLATYPSIHSSTSVVYLPFSTIAFVFFPACSASRLPWPFSPPPVSHHYPCLSASTVLSCRSGSSRCHRCVSSTPNRH
jgi:hypothetical protein